MPIVKECFLHMIGKIHPQNNNDSLNKTYVTWQWGYGKNYGCSC